MIDVLIEINGFEQLKKVEPEILSDLTDYFTGLFSGSMVGRSYRFGSLLLFRFSPGKRELESLFSTIRRAWSEVEFHGEKLRGYNLLVDRDNGLSEEDLEKWVQNRILMVQKDNSFWISREAAELFEPYAELSENGEGFIVLGDHHDTVEEEGKLVRFLDAHPLMEIFLEQCGPLLNGEKGGVVFIHGPEGSGKEHALNYLKRKIAFLPGDLPFLYFSPPRSFTGAGVPLMEGMIKRGYIGMEHYLSRHSAKSWEDLSRLFELDPEYVYKEDVELLLTLYLEAYIRQMQEALLPSILVIRRIQEYRRETLNTLGRILGSFQGRDGFITIVSGREEELPADFAELAVVRVPFRRWHMRDLSLFLDPSFLKPLAEEHREPAMCLYHSFLLMERGKGYVSGAKATRRVVRELSDIHMKVLFLATITEGICTAEEIQRIFSIKNIERGEFSTIATDLIDIGLLAEKETLTPVFPQLRIILKKELGLEGDELERIFIEEVQKGALSGKSEHCIASLFMQEEHQSVQALKRLLGRIERFITIGKHALAAPLFEECSKKMNRLGDNPELRDYLDALYLYSAVNEGRDALAGELALKFSERPEPRDLAVRTLRRLAMGEFLLASHSWRKAMEPAKAALLELQESDRAPGTAVSNLLLGRVLLAMGRIDEAKDYFLIAGETGFSPSEEAQHEVLSAYLALNYYLEGNLSAAMREAGKAGAAAFRSGKRHWELYALFLTGRILFALGRYEEAQEQFLLCRNAAILCSADAPGEVLDGWICRAMIYQGKISAAIERLSSSLKNAEHCFFRAEAYFLNEEYPEALESIEEAFQLERDHLQIFSQPLPWKWDSGFSCVEDLALTVPGNHGALYQMIRAWRGLILSRNGRAEEGQQELSRITREDKLGEHDPDSHLYLFFQALSLPEGEGESKDGLDRLTQLSKALRYVQGLGSKIEKPADRHDFLGRNYWNAKLTARGRAAKLI
jgi:tetratricopeptide (TPR) repeat protein